MINKKNSSNRVPQQRKSLAKEIHSRNISAKGSQTSVVSNSTRRNAPAPAPSAEIKSGSFEQQDKVVSNSALEKRSKGDKSNDSFRSIEEVDSDVVLKGNHKNNSKPISRTSSLKYGS